MADLKDILSNEDEAMNDDELMKYLEDNLSEEEKNAVEKKMAASSFANDAVEGLQEFKNKQQLDEYVHQLNKDLHHHLGKRKKRKEKHHLKDNSWIILSVVIILLLCFIAYMVIRIHNKRKGPAVANFTIHIQKIYKNKYEI